MMNERVLLFRPLGKTLLHSEIQPKSGSDTTSLNSPCDVSFTVPAHWHNRIAADGSPFFMKRGTLVVVERANRTIRAAGLVDDLKPTENSLEVSAGGFSMVLGQSGPWEGPQRTYVTEDPVALFRDIVAHVQTYPDANLGMRVTGATRSGGMVGYPGSRRWQELNREYQRYKPDLDRFERRVLHREREHSRRLEAMFRAAGLKRVGEVSVAADAPADPGYKADSTLWVQESTGRAYRWRDGRWVSQSQADSAVASWRDYQRFVDRAKADLEITQYRAEPVEAQLEELEHEAREEYGLYFWQNHDLNQVIEDLTMLGPFQYRERAAWTADDQLDLMLEVGAPHVGVRRDELHLELGVNVHAIPDLDYGDVFTGLVLFGEGEGSSVLSAQRSWGAEHIVRNIFVETDKDARTRGLTDATANRLARDLQDGQGLKVSGLVVSHSNRLVPEGSFSVGDVLLVTGVLPDGTKMNRWVRVLEAQHEWGSGETSVEVEAA